LTQRAPSHALTLYRGLGQPVPPTDEGARTDVYLARACPFRTRREWQAACEAGHLLVNGMPVRASRRLNAGDRLSVYHPQENEPEVDIEIGLVGEAPGILAIAKPGNLPMHESGLYWRNTLHALVARDFGPEWHAVHRLDRETSGVVLFAATPDLRRKLSEAFEEHRVHKRYLAIGMGMAEWSELELEAPIAPDPYSRFPRGMVAAGGQDACTAFRVLQRAGDTTLLEARPRTGRNNQIRIHAAYLDLPLLGEKLYAPDPAAFEAYMRYGDGPIARRAAGFPRHALHAAEVSLTHPETGRELMMSAPFAEDLEREWARRCRLALSSPCSLGLSVPTARTASASSL
jgi:RluA family pseudouridine synthase